MGESGDATACLLRLIQELKSVGYQPQGVTFTDDGHLKSLNVVPLVPSETDSSRGETGPERAARERELMFERYRRAAGGIRPTELP